VAEKTNTSDSGLGPTLDISDEDIYEAMTEIPGYLDITPGDFKEVYLLALRHAAERLKRSLKAKDVMTRDVAWVSPDTPLGDVAGLMARRGVSGVPVVSQGKVVGIISEKDFLSHLGTGEVRNFMSVVAQCLKQKTCKALPIRERTAGDIMAAPAVTVGEDTAVLEIARIFDEKKINRVPVIDAQGRLVGIVARGDIVRISSLP